MRSAAASLDDGSVSLEKERFSGRPVQLSGMHVSIDDLQPAFTGGIDFAVRFRNEIDPFQNKTGEVISNVLVPVR